MKSLKSCLVLIGVSAALHAVAVPIVSNVQMQQIEGTKDVRITYDLADNFNTQLWVTVSAYPTNSVPMWGTGYFPLNTIDGDARCWVAPGLGKEIIWHAGSDWNGRYCDSAKAVLVATAGSSYSDRQICPNGNMKFTIGGKWSIESGCVSSVGVQNYEQSFSASVNGSGVLTWSWSLSSSSYSKLCLYVDGSCVRTKTTSGSSTQSYTISQSGPHSIRWGYKKTTSNSGYSASVSNVIWK